MKKAFTLAEVLITLGIIGVIAALIVPAISNVKPDKNKTAYLQVYDTISQTVKSLAANSRLYPVCNDPNVEDNVNCSQYPLLNTSRPLDERYNNAIYQGDRKLCSLMALSLGVAEDDIGCSNTTYAFNAADYTDGFANESFVTKNGMRWRIVPQIATYTNNFEARFQNDIYVDIDPTNNNIDGRDRSCIFDEENCTQPDIFKFLVSADGKVIPADPMGRLYISGRKSLVRKDLEEDAFDEDNVITANLPTSDRVFLYSKCNGEGGSPCGEGEAMEITADGINCTAPIGGGGGGGPLDEIRNCLEDIVPSNTIHEACGLKFNEFFDTLDEDGGVLNVSLLYPANSTVTWYPYVGVFARTKSGGAARKYIVSGFSCSIPAGGTSCSIPISELYAKVQQLPNIENLNIQSYDLPPLTLGYQYLETVYPHFDNKYMYYSGINSWEYFSSDLFNIDAIPDGDYITYY